MPTFIENGHKFRQLVEKDLLFEKAPKKSKQEQLGGLIPP